jgi:hypothetical protein
MSLGREADISSDQFFPSLRARFDFLFSPTDPLRRLCLEEELGFVLRATPIGQV